MDKQLTLFAEDFPAKTLASPERVRGLQESDLASGFSSTASSKKSGRATRSLKTLQPFVLEDWTKCSGASLRSGMMRNGTVYPLQPLAHLTDGTESGSWPTPTTMDGMAPKTPTAIQREMEEVRPGRTSPSNLRDQVTWGETFEEVKKKLWPTPTARDWKDNFQSLDKLNGQYLKRDSPSLALTVGYQEQTASGKLNPQWVEWLMGYPSGWTDLNS